MSEFQSFLAPYIEEYKRWGESTGILPENGKARIKEFDRYCSAHGPYDSELDQKTVDEWFKKRNSEKINSCRSRIYPVIAFLKYTNAHEYTHVIIPIPPKAQGRTYIPHAFTEQELKDFFSQADHLSITGDKTKAAILKLIISVFFRLIYSTGMRICEAYWLKVQDVDLEHGIISIRKSKCSIEHYVVLHDSMLEILRIYNQTMSKMIPDREYFFSNKDGRPLSQNQVDYFFRRIWKNVSSEYANPYALRHNYAITNINSWVGDKYAFFDKFVSLSKSMGHMTLESTKYYYSFVPGLADIIEEVSNDSFEEMIPDIEYDED